jgi:Tol biopolymer transport system component
MKKISMILIVLVILLFSQLIGCATTMDQGKEDGIGSISFSPDGKKLLFTRIKDDLPQMIYIYNMKTGELIAYKSPVGELWDEPQYSFDGKHIVFVTIPLKIQHIKGSFFSKKTIKLSDLNNNSPITIKDPFKNPSEIYMDFNNSQLAVMEPDGKNVRKITNSPGLKQHPSFSHSGRKIIYALQHDPNIRGVASTDIYEVDVKTGQQTRLTQFSFLWVSKPYYFPDDKMFIFEGRNFMDYPGIPGRPTTEYFLKVGKMREEFHSKYGNNSIYVMQGNENELKPYIVMPDYPEKFPGASPGDVYSNSPSLNADGAVLIFRARGYKPDGSGDDEDHLYQYSSDGNHRSITQITRYGNATVSPDGKLIVIIPVPSYIVIYQIKEGTSRKITLPEKPSRIINSQ